LGSRPARAVYAVVTSTDMWDSLRGRVPERAIQAGAQSGQLERYVFILAFAGMRGTSGCSLTIQSITQRGDFVEVRVKEDKPDPSQIVEPATTLPYQLVRVERASLGSRASLTFTFWDAQGNVLHREVVAFSW
jgi:hypothetical protein